MSAWRDTASDSALGPPDTLEPEILREYERLREGLGLLDEDESEAESGAEPRTADARLLGRYRLGRVIGRGGMGIVYLAEDTELGRDVAIKLVRAREPKMRPGLQARLHREARVLARFTHPNVVRVYDAGKEGSEVFLAMEYVEGETLLAWLRGEPSLHEVLDAYLQAAAGLHAAHLAGIVHRDFKPENVFIKPDGSVLVGDFGLAMFEGLHELDALELGHESGRLTALGAKLGTLGFMAPEQLRGGTVDARSDQFGLCVAMWEAITGRRPYAGHRADELLTSMEAGEFERERDLPRWLRPLLRRGLAMDPSDRHASVGDLANAIAGTLDRRRVRRPWMIAGVVVLGLATGLGLGSKVLASDTCEARQRVDELLDSGEVELRARFDGQSAGAIRELERALESSRGRLRGAAERVCASSGERGVSRTRALDRALDELEAALRDPAALEPAAWLGLLDELASLDIDAPAIDPEIARLIDASRQADRAGEITRARELVDRALALAEPSGIRSPELAEVMFWRGHVLRRQGETAGALEALAAAEHAASRSGHGELELRARLLRAAITIKVAGNYDGGAELLRNTTYVLDELSSPLSSARAQLWELEAALDRHAGVPVRALVRQTAALLVHGALHPDRIAAIKAHVTLGTTWQGIGDIPRARRQYAIALELLDAGLDHQELRSDVTFNLALIDLESDDSEVRAQAIADLERLRAAEDHRNAISAAHALLYVALEDDDVNRIAELREEVRGTVYDDQFAILADARLGNLTDLESLMEARSMAAGLDLAKLQLSLAQILCTYTRELATQAAAESITDDPSDEHLHVREQAEAFLSSFECE